MNMTAIQSAQNSAMEWACDDNNRGGFVGQYASAEQAASVAESLRAEGHTVSRSDNASAVDRVPASEWWVWVGPAGVGAIYSARIIDGRPSEGGTVWREGWTGEADSPAEALDKAESWIDENAWPNAVDYGCNPGDVVEISVMLDNGHHRTIQYEAA